MPNPLLLSLELFSEDEEQGICNEEADAHGLFGDGQVEVTGLQEEDERPPDPPHHLLAFAPRQKFFVSTLSHEIRNLLSHLHHPHHHNHDGNKPREEVVDADVASEQLTESAIVSYCDSEALVHKPMPIPAHCEPAKDEDDDGEDDEKYPDLRHTLFDDIEDLSSGGSMIELVKRSKEERGEEFVLENEIDHIADLFIRRFHRQMWLQKMESFKNYQEMLQRSG